MAPRTDSDPGLIRLFAPLHKRALGVALGVATAGGMFLVSAVPLLTGAVNEFELGLLGQYFYGYSLTWGGAVVGALWGFAIGFVGGFTLALCRNALLTLRLVQLRARAEYVKTRDFLDHI